MMARLDGYCGRLAKPLLGTGAAAIVAAAAPAHASPVFAVLPVAYSITLPTTCSDDASSMMAVQAIPAGFETTGSAILEHRESALDRIRMQQQSGIAEEQAPVAAPVAAPIAAPFAAAPCSLAAPSQALAVPVSVSLSAAPQLSAEAPVATASLPASAASDLFLDSARVRIGFTPSTAQWNRVSATTLSRRTARNLVGAARADSHDTARRVNEWVNDAIAHVEDSVLYGRRDYWANARETLNRRQGDCEDFAILKYQLLLSLGFDADDMFLTLAWDKVRGADHALLVVRLDDGFYMLDNAFNQLLPASQSYDYRPSVSYSGAGSWLHTETATAASAAPFHLSVNATSNPRDIGLNR